MAEHQPRFVEQDRGRLAVQRALDAAEQVPEHGQGEAIAERHQFLDLEDREVGELEAIFTGVEQVTHGAAHGVLLETARMVVS